MPVAHARAERGPGSCRVLRRNPDSPAPLQRNHEASDRRPSGRAQAAKLRRVRAAVDRSATECETYHVPEKELEETPG